MLVLDRLAEMTKNLLFLQSHVAGLQVAGEDLSDADRDDVLSETLPRLAFIEHAYRGDETNWWIPNYQALEPLVRSAGLKVLARPHPEILVAEPERYLGTVRSRRLVFPRYGEPGGTVFPGPPLEPAEG